MKNSKVEICFIGNAIVDILSKISNKTLNKLEILKGSMQLVDEKSSNKILKYIKDPSIISGGSAANTAVGFKSFGGTCSFIGQIGNDKFGDLFSKDLNNSGIFFKPKNFQSTDKTSKSIISMHFPLARLDRTMYSIHPWRDLSLSPAAWFPHSEKAWHLRLLGHCFKPEVIL